MSSIFLSAEWRSLVMLNYAVDRVVLEPLLPRGVELDLWEGGALVSMVGFLFLDCRVLGVPIPFHRNFEEVNLRFYVRRRVDGEWRRGVVFVREIVPRRAIALVARVAYNEPYIALPMRHEVPERGGEFSYAWKFGGRWHSLGARTCGEAAPIAPGSAEEFIFEHYWGYTRQRDGGTADYEVEHPSWRIWQTDRTTFDCDVGALYGADFIEPLRATPHSAFVAEGSRITVRRAGRVSAS